MLGPRSLQTLQVAPTDRTPWLPSSGPSLSSGSSRQLAAGMQHREAIVALWAIPDT